MEPRKYRILDLFSGTGSATQAFRDDPRCIVLSVDNDATRDADFTCTIKEFWQHYIAEIEPIHFDFIWASPPCKTFSIANTPMSVNWWRGKPSSPAVFEALANVAYTLKIIEHLNPPYWALENPRGMLRTIHMMDQYPRRTVTYCQYGHDAMKPTDLWGRLPPTWLPKSCSNGDDCHINVASEGISATEAKSYDNKIMVPYGLSLSIKDALDEVGWEAIPIATLMDFDSDAR